MRHKLLLFLLYIILGLLLEGICELIHSDYLSNLYRTPFFAVLVAITVFSFTLFSYVSGKISEIEKKYEYSFCNTRKELGDSFLLLIGCDIIIILLLILRYSDLSRSWLGLYALMSALNTIFFCIVHILIDLGVTIFKLFETMGDVNSGKIQLKPYNKDILLLKYLLYNKAKPMEWVEKWLKKQGYEEESLEGIKSIIYNTQGFYSVDDGKIVFLGDVFVVGKIEELKMES